MPVVALTGGIAAGKSAVTEVLVHHGVAVIDADDLAREVVRPGTPTLAAIAERFGVEVLHPDGTLNREALGAVVFADDIARADLNAIVHPAVGAESARRFAEHQRDHPNVPLVYAVPLLVETGRQDEFDLVVVVHAPAETRKARLVDHRGLSPEEAAGRVAAQATDEDRLSIADVVVDASHEPEQTREQAEALATLLVRHWPDTLNAIPRMLSGASE